MQEKPERSFQRQRPLIRKGIRLNGQGISWLHILV